MTHSTGPACGNNPNHQMTPGDREAVDNFRAYLERRAADRTALRDRIAEAIRQSDFREWPLRRSFTAADAVLAVLPEVADKATVYREAADQLGCMDYDTDSNDYGYDTYRDAWNGGVMDAADRLRRMADETATELADTLPAWLYQRFMPDGIGWDQLDEDDRSYWEHQARAVRRAVARGGFKQPAAGARQDGAES
jgi:hypothetical protein